MSHPDDIRWSRFCRDIVPRIQTVRLLDRPCVDCLPCMAHQPVRETMQVRRCHRCQVVKSLLDDFNRDVSKPLGRRYACRDCQRTENAQSNQERKRRVAAEIVRRAS